MSSCTRKMRKIVFDIETKNTFTEVGSNSAADLDLSIICIHDSETDEYSSYLEDELPQLWPSLESADMIIGYNSVHFDLPLLNKYYTGDLSQIRHLDLLVEIRSSLGRRPKLDNVAAGTLGTSKSGHGLQAVTWWKQGEIDKIRQYCLDDVKITKQVYDYAREHNKVLLKEAGKVVEIPLNADTWENTEKNGMTPTLGF